jgi:molybdate transport system substrate-binding protein
MGPQLKILSAGAVKRGVAEIAKQYESETACVISVEFATAPSVRERLRKREQVDVVVLPPAMLDELAREGAIDDTHRGHIGRSRMGVFVKRGAPLPDISSADAFRQALLAADAVVYNTASSGLYMERLLQKLGVSDSLRDRIVKVASGAAVMKEVARHPGNAIGTGQLSEIRVQLDKGTAIALVGPLPGEIQNETPYDAAVTTTTTAAAEACRLVTALTSDAAKKVFAATGIEHMKATGSRRAATK